MQLSTNKMTFLAFLVSSMSQLLSHASKITDVIHADLLALYSVGRCLTPLKHLGCLNFPIVNNGRFSLPVILVHTNTVTLSLLFFPPEHFSPAKACVLLGSSLQYKPVSSALNTSSALYCCRMGISVCCFHSSQTSLSTKALSPEIARYVILCLSFHHDIQPFEHVQLSVGSNARHISSALSFKMLPLMGTA